MSSNRQRVTTLLAGQETLRAAEVVALDIPSREKFGELLHFLLERELHLVACDFAEHVVHLCNDSPQPRVTIEAKRRWVRGEISDEELAAAQDGASAAAHAAAVAISKAAPRAKELAAVWDTAKNAAARASYDAGVAALDAKCSAAAKRTMWGIDFGDAARKADSAASKAAASAAARATAEAAAGAVSSAASIAAISAASRDGAWAAFWAASKDAFIAASKAASMARASVTIAASMAVSSAAARDAEMKWQIERVLEYIDEREGGMIERANER